LRMRNEGALQEGYFYLVALRYQKEFLGIYRNEWNGQCCIRKCGYVVKNLTIGEPPCPSLHF
jgi:hypothetical protein